jgi:heterotetrameric sarcosine oxidase gamma subunit
VADLIAPGPIARSPIAPGLIARSPVRPVEPAVLAGWEVTGRASAADLTLTDVTPLAKVMVRAPHDGGVARVLGVPFGRAVRDGDGALVTGSGPGEWLVLGPPGQGPALMQRLTGLAGPDGSVAPDGRAGPAAGQELVTVLDLTHARALLRLTGPAAARVLAKVCAIDLADDVTPDGTAFRSSVARVVTDVVRDDVVRDDVVRDDVVRDDVVRDDVVRDDQDRDDQDRDDQDRPAGPAPSYLLHCERSYGQYLFDALLDAGGEFGIDIDGFRLLDTRS